jgi:hypothetical protein
MAFRPAMLPNARIRSVVGNMNGEGIEKRNAFIWDKLDRRSAYFLGVGVGLLIAGVTSGIAYLKVDRPTLLFDLVLFDLILSVIVVSVAYFLNTKRRRSKTA